MLTKAMTADPQLDVIVCTAPEPTEESYSLVAPISVARIYCKRKRQLRLADKGQ